MKNKNLNEAFRMLDKENLKHTESVPAEELYYSPAYEKHIASLFDEKKAFSWKTFGKRAVAFALCAAFAVGIFVAMPKTKQPDTSEPNPPLQTEITNVDNVDFVIVNEGIKSEELAELIEQRGYMEGTYEYEYMQILSEISYYTGIAQTYLANAKYHRENAVYEKNSFIGCDFFERIDIDEWNAPYEDMVRYGVEMLSSCGFEPTYITIEMFTDYWFRESDLGIRRGVATCAGLPLTDMHETMTEYAEKLLALEEKYPDYEGELTVSTYVREMAEKVIEACKPVGENEETYLLAWQEYYNDIQPKVIVTEEFIPELDAVKITITGEGRYTTVELAPRFIENYQYETFINTHNFYNQQQIPTQTFSIYMPIYTYYNPDRKPLRITKYHNETDTTSYDEMYELKLNPADYFSDDLITMENDQLDAALRAHFGGDYSERDLLHVTGILVQNHNGNPQIILDTWENGKRDSLYIPLDETETLSEELENDLHHFHGLAYCQRNANAEYLVSDALLEELQPYIVNPDIEQLTPVT
ncbi:MAG: hypothetical protein IJ489_08450 [Clostridia bacterium]|nr:hypothetical protein [Clostridia bacterium]